MGLAYHRLVAQALAESLYTHEAKYDTKRAEIARLFYGINPPPMKTLETLEVGDFVQSKDNHITHLRSVLAVLPGGLYALGPLHDIRSTDNHDCFSRWMTATQLAQYNYTPYDAPATEMTVAEISRALGKTIKVVE